MKKIFALVLALTMIFCLCCCGQKETTEDVMDVAEVPAMKVGLVCLHDENSGYDYNFISAFISACEKTGVEYEIRTNIAESEDAYNACCECADDGCSIVFCDSYGHQPYALQAATEYPEVQFVSCTGDMANSAGVENFHNAFASIYEGRYLAGVVAGLKMNEMIEAGLISEDEAVLGYVSAMSYAECKSGYTSYFLGARSVCPTATMKVLFTGTWYDETLEKECATKLIDSGCVVISQHADSSGAPNACEAMGVPNVSYNGSTISYAPNTYMISSRINWEPYFEYAITSILNGENFAIDWCGTVEGGSVELTEINEAVCPEGTAEVLEEVKTKLESGEIHVFDCDAWTVNGEHLTTYDKVAFYEGNECIWDGYFHESETRSAPYFDIDIDGIILL